MVKMTVVEQIVLTLRSPDRLAPARMPVAAGKNTAKTVKKSSPCSYAG